MVTHNWDSWNRIAEELVLPHVNSFVGIEGSFFLAYELLCLILSYSIVGKIRSSAF